MGGRRVTYEEWLEEVKWTMNEEIGRSDYPEELLKQFYTEGCSATKTAMSICNDYDEED